MLESHEKRVFKFKHLERMRRSIRFDLELAKTGTLIFALKTALDFLNGSFECECQMCGMWYELGDLDIEGRCTMCVAMNVDLVGPARVMLKQ